MGCDFSPFTCRELGLGTLLGPSQLFTVRAADAAVAVGAAVLALRVAALGGLLPFCILLFRSLSQIGYGHRGGVGAVALRRTGLICIDL